MASLLPLVLVLALLAFFFLSQRRRRRDTENLQQTIAVGTEIMTTAGLYGRVVGLEDDTFQLEIADGVVVRYARAAIGRIITTPMTDDIEPAEPDAEDNDHSDSDAGGTR